MEMPVKRRTREGPLRCSHRRRRAVLTRPPETQWHRSRGNLAL